MGGRHSQPALVPPFNLRLATAKGLVVTAPSPTLAVAQPHRAIRISPAQRLVQNRPPGWPDRLRLRGH